MVEERKLWRNRYFVALLVGQFISELGDHVYRLAVPWLLFDMTRSALHMSIARSLDFIPTVILGSFIGVLADRWNRKNTFLYSVLSQVMLVGLVALLAQGGGLTVPVLYALLLLLAIAGRFAGVVHTAILPELVPREQLMDANAKFSLSSSIAQLLGPSAAGVIIAFVSASGSLWIDVISFAPLILAIWLLPSSLPTGPKATGVSMKAELKEGVQFLLRQRELLYSTILVTLTNITTSVTAALGVYYLRSDLQLSSTQVGLVFSAMTVGSLLVGLLGARLKRFGSLLNLQLIASSGIGIAVVMLGLARSWMLAMASYALLGFFTIAINIPYVTLRQTLTPRDMLGRIAGLTSMIMKGVAPLAMAAAGLLAEWVAASSVLLTAGIIGIGAAAAMRLVTRTVQLNVTAEN